MKEENRSFNLDDRTRITFSSNVDDESAEKVVEEARKASDEVRKQRDASPPEVQILMRVRYIFEHKGLPFLWLKNPLWFTEKSMPLILDAAWGWAIKFEGRGLPINPPKAKVEHLEIEGARVILVRMPYPPMIPFCFRIAMIQKQDGSTLYLTQERTSETIPLDSALCSWESTVKDPQSISDLRHGNYGCMFSRRRSDMLDHIAHVITGRLGPRIMMTQDVVRSRPGF